jgi:hypothetical protein
MRFEILMVVRLPSVVPHQGLTLKMDTIRSSEMSVTI